MKVKDFVEKELKNYKDIVKTDAYLPFQEKQSIVRRIVDVTTHFPVSEDERIYKEDSISRFMLFSLTLIDRYTDLEIDFKDSLKEFNLLDKNGMIDKLIEEIPANEKDRLDCMLEMAIEDAYENERSMNGVLDKLKTILDTFGNNLEGNLLSLANLAGIEQEQQ